ncbi:MAG: hypothetical protein IJ250_00820 [Bacteroidales bacterium]|nr:hypothetical protein [Bacteroidales bacterium]
MDDITVKTLKSVMVNTLFNDLGFVVGNRYIELVEAQSTWNPNKTLRLLYYLAESYKRYLEETNLSEHSKTRVTIPQPELYLVYSGDKNVPEEISFAEEFFGGNSAVDLKVKVIKDVSEQIAGQYIGFCKVFDEQRKIHKNSIECAKETIRICKEKGYIAEYLALHEKEVVTMLDELFNEEYLREQYDKAIATKERQEGRREGVITTLIKLVKEGLLTVSQAAVRAKVTEPEFEKMLAAYGEGATTA